MLQVTGGRSGTLRVSVLATLVCSRCLRHSYRSRSGLWLPASERTKEVVEEDVRKEEVDIDGETTGRRDE